MGPAWDLASETIKAHQQIFGCGSSGCVGWHSLCHAELGLAAAKLRCTNRYVMGMTDVARAGSLKGVHLLGTGNWAAPNQAKSALRTVSILNMTHCWTRMSSRVTFEGWSARPRHPQKGAAVMA